VKRAFYLPSIVAVVLALSSLGGRSVSAADWPQFLGPNRNGISTETKLLDKFPAGGPPEVWRVKGGGGMSGLVISNGKLATMVERKGQQQVILLDAKTGKPVWNTAIAPAYRNSMGAGPRATPTIDGELLFAFTGDGILAALKLSDGSLVWSHNVVKDMEGRIADYGMASSPLIVGDLVVVTAGAPGATVVAYNKTTGKVAWKTGRDSAGYSSAALLTIAGRKQIVAFTGQSALGLDPKSGASLWRFPYSTDYECNIATPLAWKNRVFLSAGENHGSTLLELKPDGKKFALKTVWDSTGRRSVLRNEWQTSVLLDGHLYGMDNVGGAGPITHLTCIDASDGTRAWQQARFGKGNLIAADGKLFISTIDGEIVIVAASPKSFRELARAKVIGPTRQAPALANGLLYLRDGSEILCLDVRKK
jgi:outer membrane protein assembly factor BamB